MLMPVKVSSGLTSQRFITARVRQVRSQHSVRCSQVAQVAEDHRQRVTEVQDRKNSLLGCVEHDDDSYGSDEELRSPSPLATVSATTYECIRISMDGRADQLLLKRRNLLRSFNLAPRDLRRIDPHLTFTRASPTLYSKDNVLLVQLSGVRLIITAQSAVLLDPSCRPAKQFLSQIVTRLQVSAGQRIMDQYSLDSDQRGDRSGGRYLGQIPFELEILEAALNVAIAELDNELNQARKRVQQCLRKLPRDITPNNLDDLRQIKVVLVQLESSSDAYREMLEDIMDDQDELKEINLSSRVLREEARRARDRERLEREMARERESQSTGEQRRINEDSSSQYLGTARDEFIRNSSQNPSLFMDHEYQPPQESTSQRLPPLPPPARGTAQRSKSDLRDPVYTGYREWERSMKDGTYNTTNEPTDPDTPDTQTRSRRKFEWFAAPADKPTVAARLRSRALMTEVSTDASDPTQGDGTSDASDTSQGEGTSGTERASRRIQDERRRRKESAELRHEQLWFAREQSFQASKNARPKGNDRNRGDQVNTDTPITSRGSVRPRRMTGSEGENYIMYSFDGDHFERHVEMDLTHQQQQRNFFELDNDARARRQGTLFQNGHQSNGSVQSQATSSSNLSDEVWTDWQGHTVRPTDRLDEDRAIESGAEQELREMEEAEQEEQDIEEVEDLLEFYLQRATAVHTESESLLAGARDLEESIGLALSARRFEVNRLELQLSIGGFAAALGAMFAGIFGMNLRSCLEESVVGFWGVSIGITLVCVWVYWAIMNWTRSKRIFVQ